MARHVSTVQTWTPALVTLAQMGATAQASANTYTLREWAARLATKAAPKDFRGQLEKLYLGILERWRYVLEDGEWIHGTPRSLLGTVLGTDYNCCASCPSGERCDVEKTPWKERGWGDCDDVATLVAAGVIALGMRPMFRVSTGGSGGAHVSVAALTPRGEVVQIDPVGHPEHPFGWAQSGPGIEVTYFSIDGSPVGNQPAPLGAFGTTMQAAQPFVRGPQFPFQQSSMVWAAAPYGFGAAVANEGTYLGVLSTTRDRRALTPYQGRVPRHFVAVAPGDDRGARVLAIPGWHARRMMSGVVIEGTPAVDQFGASYAYSQPLDLWIPAASRAANEAAYGFGATSKADRRAARKARRRRGLAKVGRFVKRIGAGIRKVVSKVLGSKFVQTIVAGILQVFGLPMAATKALLRVAAEFTGEGGFIALFKKLRKDPKGALKLLAKTVAAAGGSDLLKRLKIKGFSGQVDGYAPAVYEMVQGGAPFYASPVEGIVGLDGALGDAGEGGVAIASEPTPGYRYQIRKGENLSTVAKRAYGTALPGSKWISAVKANQQFTRPASSDYERKYIGSRVVSFNPKFDGEGGYAVIYIPTQEGDEPALIPILRPDGGGDMPDVDDDEDQWDPGPVPVPPVPGTDETDFGPVPPGPGPEPVAPPIPTETVPVSRGPALGPVPGYNVPVSRGPALGPVPGYNIPATPADAVPEGGTRNDMPPYYPPAYTDAHEAAHESYVPIPRTPAEAVPPGGTRNDMPANHPPLIIPSGPVHGQASAQGSGLGLPLAIAALLWL